MTKYETIGNLGRKMNLPTVDLLLEKVVFEFQDVCIFIDGLDELPRHLWPQIQDTLSKILRASVHVMVSSRPVFGKEHFIPTGKKMPEFLQMTDHTQVDIRTYVHEMLKSSLRLQTRDDTRLQVENILVERSNGM